MEISLPPDLAKIVNEKVQSGLYNSPGEVIRESLRLLQEQEKLRRLRRDELRREIMLGVEQIRNGEYTEVAVSDLPAFAEKIIREARENVAKRKAS